MFFRIPSERITDRLEELYEYLHNFPDSRLAPAVRSEIAYLEELQ